MNNKLYQVHYKRTVFLKNGKKHTYFHTNPVCYGTPPENGKEEFCLWGALLKIEDYIPEFTGHKSWRGRIWCQISVGDNIGYRDHVNIFQDDFEKVIIEKETEILALKKFTIKTLMEKLNAEEFLMFMKDNDVNLSFIKS